MSSDYKRVSDALANGVEPSMLCSTCPWDRTCLTPPQMTAAEVQAEIDRAKAEDEVEKEKALAAGEKPGLGFGSLMTALVMGQNDKQAAICPVFALRLRASNGRSLVDGLRSQMLGWDDNA